MSAQMEAEVRTGLVIKSCPFCGKAACTNTIKWADSYLKEQELPEGIRYGVNCMYCSAQNRGFHGAATEAEAIERWNKRAPNHVLEAEVAQLRADRDALVVALRSIIGGADGDPYGCAEEAMSAHYERTDSIQERAQKAPE